MGFFKSPKVRSLLQGEPNPLSLGATPLRLSHNISLSTSPWSPPLQEAIAPSPLPKRPALPSATSSRGGYASDYPCLLPAPPPTQYPPVMSCLLGFHKAWAVQGASPIPLSMVSGFFSRIFLVLKKSGEVHPIFNLQALNGFLRTKCSKMESESSSELILSGMWTYSINLISTHPKSRNFLQVSFKERAFQFKTLPFGLSSAVTALLAFFSREPPSGDTKGSSSVDISLVHMAHQSPL